MLTLMFGCELWKSGMSFFRSFIDGLSTEPTVMVVALPPPPPPAPPEHAAPTSAITSPRTMVIVGLEIAEWFGDRSFLYLMQSHLTYYSATGPVMTTLSKDNVVYITQICLDYRRRRRPALRHRPRLGPAHQ